MRLLAEFILRARWSAVGVVAGSVVVPLLFWLSAPALALVTLRRGAGEGALITALSTVVLMGAFGVSGAPLAGVLVPLAGLWLPALAGAAVLRGTVSWSLTLQMLAGGFTLALLGFYGVLGDAAAFWAEWMRSVEPQLQLSAEGRAQWERMMTVAPSMLTGAMFGTALSVVAASLLLARWWQALLFNPGGFRAEFHGLRLQRGYAIAAAAALFIGAMAGPGPLYDAGFVLSSVFALQGLAVVHAIAYAREWNVVWLVLLYTILPLILRLMAVLGLVDVFVDLRRRLLGPANGSG